MNKNLKVLPIKYSRDIERLERLLDHAFCVPAGGVGHYWDDFPIWNPRFSKKTVSSLGLFNEKNIFISSASVRRVDWKLPEEGVLPVAVIGAVVTDPLFRSQGHAGQLLFQIMERLYAQKVKIIILWGQYTALYQTLGFKQWGLQAQLALSFLPDILKNSVKNELFLDPENVQEGFNSEIFSLQRARPQGFKLLASDLSWMRQHRNVRWFSCIDANSRQVRAFLAFGRGIDLPHLIHEWGGEKEALLSLLFFLKQRFPTLGMLGSVGVLQALGFELSQFKLSPLALMHSQEPLDQLVPLVEEAWIWGLDSS